MALKEYLEEDIEGLIDQIETLKAALAACQAAPASAAGLTAEQLRRGAECISFAAMQPSVNYPDTYYELATAFREAAKRLEAAESEASDG